LHPVHHGCRGLPARATGRHAGGMGVEPTVFLSVNPHLDASTAALGDGVGHRGTGWVNHGQEPHKTQVGGWEVHGICVKLEGLWKLVLRQVQVAET
uniref:Uncharacterized protein n=1 Tax=Junco hyemalis TaxID=40217 RepID=A0A8C5J9Q8_JUNHY